MGGYREGAGRPKGTGRYGEVTQPIRVPIKLLPKIKALLEEPEMVLDSRYAIPLYTTRVAAGFPSPADDDIDTHLDLNQHLIPKPSTTFFLRVQGDSMIDAGIQENDLLIVDQFLEARDGKIVIAVLNGELTVKRFRNSKGQVWLQAENPKYPAIELREELDFKISGVVTHVIHSF